jgi:Macrocin-O-methyltransferase (TylF)
MNEQLKQVGILQERNTPENLAYYDALVQFFERDHSSSLLKLRSFALYTPRQVISDFLARYELYRMISGVQGSIVECGVFNGQGLFSFAHFSAITEPNNLTREIIGFDTFEGFPEVSEQDRGADENIVRPGGLNADSYARLEAAVSLFDSNRFLGHIPKIRLVKGDLLKTLDPYLDSNPHLLVALLYLDVDIYEPTKLALTRLLPRMPKGSIVAFDELNHQAFPGETCALLDVIDVRKIEIQRVPFCSRISYFRVG